MSEIQSGVSSVRKEIAIVAGPKDWCDTRESWLARVPRKVPTVSFRTVKALFYGEIDNPNHWAARDIRRAAELIEARKEASALAVQYQSIAGGMRVQDENFYRAEIDRLERIARIISAVDRT
ncbi:MAG: hypothetical protein H0V18_09195 [Pyrinomonadaceae bacterium]|nr:hypothetical protein [Pyrinomonadaceae bacterium]